MRAMILAAGVGSRLAPITDIIPKPTIPVLGKPVLDRIIDLLKSHGFNEFIANTHYLGEKIFDLYQDRINIKHEADLTGVAGGIRTCADFLRAGKDSFVVIMGDALTDINLTEMLAQHKASGRLATIAIKEVEDTTHFGVICFDEDKKVTDFQEKPRPEEALSNWANTGVYIFEPAILDYIPSAEVYPIYDVAHDLFPDLLKQKIELNIYQTNSYWADLGTHEQYRQTLFDCLEGKFNIDIEGQKYSWGYLANSAYLSSGCYIKGKAYIGNNSRVGRVIMKGNVILEDNVIIEDDVVLENCLIMSNSIIKKGCKIKDVNIKPHDEVFPTSSPAKDAIEIFPLTNARTIKTETELREKFIDNNEADNKFLAFLAEASKKINRLFVEKR